MLVMISVVSGIVGLLIIYTKLVFNFAKLQGQLQENTTILTKIEIKLDNYDERFDLIERRLNTIETEHHMIHERRKP